MEIRIDDQNVLIHRDTPWDAKSFGFNTNEILSLKYTDNDAAKQLLKMFDYQCKEREITFSYTRIEAEDKWLRNILPQLGFYYAETTLYLTKNDLVKENFGTCFKNDLPLSVPDAKDFEQIRNIARNDFNYSRFHEDLNINNNAARQRYYNWIDDLQKQNKQFVQYKQNDEVISFLAYEIDGDKVDLILAGSVADKGFVSFGFWASFLTFFQKLGVKRAKTVISASNIGIMNLYSKLNFKFDKSMLGFHKFHHINQ